MAKWVTSNVQGKVKIRGRGKIEVFRVELQIVDEDLEFEPGVDLITSQSRTRANEGVNRCITKSS
jgi:hypothetical protein